MGGMHGDMTRSDCSPLVAERPSSSMSVAPKRGILELAGAAMQDLATQRRPTSTRARWRAVGQSDQKRGLCSSRAAATERPRNDGVVAASGSGPSTPRLSGCLTVDPRLGPIPRRAGSAAQSADPWLRRTGRAEPHMHAGSSEPATRPWAAAISQPGVTAKSRLHDRSSTPHNHLTAMNPQAGITSSSGSVRGYTASGQGFMLPHTTIDVADRRRLGTRVGVSSRRDFQALENPRMAAADMVAHGGRQFDALPAQLLWLYALVATIVMAILALAGVAQPLTPAPAAAPAPAPTRHTADVCPPVVAHAKMPDALITPGLITPGDRSRLDASLTELVDPSLLDPSLFTPGERCVSGYVPKKLQWLTSMSKAMHDANITTPDQRAAFMAQIAEETGGLRMVTERPWGLPRSEWNDEQVVRNYFNNKYANINGNGDVSSGDGYNYRGRGILQITGKANYAAVSEKLYGDDRLVQNPDLVSQPDAACATAAAYWNENDLNRFIPPGQPVTPQEFRDLGSTINTGSPGHVPNNADTREKYWEVAKEAFGVG